MSPVIFAKVTISRMCTIYDGKCTVQNVYFVQWRAISRKRRQNSDLNPKCGLSSPGPGGSSQCGGQTVQFDCGLFSVYCTACIVQKSWKKRNPQAPKGPNISKIFLKFVGILATKIHVSG